MELLSILIQENIEWPSGMVWCVQDDDGNIKFSSDSSFTPYYCFSSGLWERGRVGFLDTTVHGYPISDDWNKAVISYKEYKQAKELYDNQFASPDSDNSATSWFEKGEFPPAGCECDFCNSDDEWCDWHRSVFVGFDSIGNGVVSVFGDDKGMLWLSTNPSDFSPLRTEREKAIEDMSRIMHDKGHGSVINDVTLGALLDAGYHKD